VDKNQQLVTQTVDLFAPSDRFTSSRRLYGKLHHWVLLFRRFWWLIAVVLLFVLVPVYFLTAETLPVFESRAKMWLKGRLNIGEGRGLYTEELVDYLSTQAELLRSSTIQGRALAKTKERFPQAFSAPRSESFPARVVRDAKAFFSRVTGKNSSNINAG
jgi:uncharacterized protein involved in exopolysaccharide biosynthesis